jgi:hypothetical protein
MKAGRPTSIFSVLFCWWPSTPSAPSPKGQADVAVNKARHHQRHGNFCNLRRLKADDTEIQPAPYLYIFCIILLVAVDAFGAISKGAQRWLDLGIVRGADVAVNKARHHQRHGNFCNLRRLKADDTEIQPRYRPLSAVGDCKNCRAADGGALY